MMTSVEKRAFSYFALEQKSTRSFPYIHVRRLLHSLIAGVVIGLIAVVVTISLGTLVYAGGPPSLLARGVGLTLLGAMFSNAIFALATSIPGGVIVPQDSPAAILAVVTASITGAMSITASPDRVFATVVAASALSTLLTALIFSLLGVLRLGNLVRYLPYPVVGGFLAGTGVLLLRGAFRSMTDLDLTLAALPILVRSEYVLQWLPGLVLGLILVTGLRRSNHFLLLPGLLLAAVALFYLFLMLSGITVASARAQGWLLTTMPMAALWHPLTWTTVTQVDWSVLWAHIDALVAIPVICTISLLLNSSGLELIRRCDVDFNQELRATGIGNLLSGLSGCHPGYVAMSISTLGEHMAAATRVTTLLVALVFGAALYFGSTLLAYIPTLLLDGMLLFLGFSFVGDWLFDTRSRLSKSEYLVIVLIAVAINSIGVLAGVGLGLALAVIIFVVDYSRVHVVKHALSGAHYRSNVDRSPYQRQLLAAQGEQFHIFELQGFLFFGTVNGLLGQVQSRIQTRALPTPRFVLLDFRHVNGMDASAISSFLKMKQLAITHDVVLIFANLAPMDETRLRAEVLVPKDCQHWRIVADLDHGVEWCEEQLIHTETPDATHSCSTLDQLAVLLSDHIGAPSEPGVAPIQTTSQRQKAAQLLAQMTRCELQPGQTIIRQGEAPHGVYFIEAGQLTAQLVLPDRRTVRLRTMQPGVFVGELGLYTGAAASASVVVDEPSTVYYLATNQLAQLVVTDPELAATFHCAIAQLVSARLLTATATLEALMR
ncbi:MAG: SulP family inorganic anion transporter [Caldilineaceae bacterium]